MRRKRIARELAALGHPAHQPSDEMRVKVRVLTFNRVPIDIIARIVGLDLLTLKYYYQHELELTDYEVSAAAAANIFELAAQRKDLGVALKANESIMRMKSPAWVTPVKDHTELIPIESMTLADVDREIARLIRKREEADHAKQDTEAGASDGSGGEQSEGRQEARDPAGDGEGVPPSR